MRSAGPSFQSERTGSGSAAPARTVASTVAAWVRAIWWTKTADPLSRRWASSTKSNSGRPWASSTIARA